MNELSPNAKRRKQDNAPSNRASPVAERQARRRAPKPNGKRAKPGAAPRQDRTDREEPVEDAASQPADADALETEEPAGSLASVVEQFKTVLSQGQLISMELSDIETTICRLAEYSRKADKLRELGQEYGTGADDLPTMGASPALKADAMPILGYLSAQILQIFATNEAADLVSAMADADSSVIPEYAVLKRLLDLTKKAYAIKDSFLLLPELANISSGTTVGRQANLATFVTSCFGSGEVGFYHLNEYFTETFVVEGGRILSNQVRLFLVLKTQAYLSAMTAKEQPRSEILDELFPRDLARKLLTSRAGAKTLASTEKELVSRVSNRRKFLEEQNDTDEALDALRARYRWDEFLNDLTFYLAQNFGGHVENRNRPQAIHRTSSTPLREQWESSNTEMLRMHSGESNAIPANSQPQPHLQPFSHQPSPYHDNKAPANVNEHSETPVTVADEALHPQVKPELQSPNLGGVATEIGTSQPLDQSPFTVSSPQQDNVSQTYPQQQVVGISNNPNTSFIQHQFPPPSHPGDLTVIPYSNSSQPPSLIPPLHSHFMAPVQLPPGQTASSYELLKRARRQMAAQSTGRRNGTPGTSAGTGQRQHWTDEEERALLDGIDFVGGPHWSRILQLHGPSGTQSEALRARTQVPLKDKARNIKLFILKAKTELPQYLYSVTGELNRRAPAHASNTDEDGDHPSHGGADGEVAKRAKTDHTPTPRARNATRAALTPVAPTALMYSSPYPSGFAHPSPPQYQSPYAQPPSGSRNAESQTLSGISPHDPSVPNGHPAHASNGTHGGDYSFGPEDESIGTSAAAEAARMIQAMMADGQAMMPQGHADGDRGEGDRIDPALS